MHVCGWFAYYSILVLFLRKYTLARTIVHAEDMGKENASADLERGTGSEETGEKEEEIVNEGGSLEKN